MKPISLILLCFALMACGAEQPFDPLAGDKIDRAIEDALAGTALYLFTGEGEDEEIVYWRLHADGRYEFRQTSRSQWRFWATGRWWIRGEWLYCDRRDGANWLHHESHPMEPGPLAVSFELVGPDIEGANWAIVRGHVYTVVDEDGWREVIAAFHEED